MSYGNPFEKQISNRNFLSPTGFKFTLQRAPKVAFFGNSANLPAISMGTAIQSTYLKNIDRPGDKVEFGDFNYRFLVDENLENYLEIFNWIRGLGYPESLSEIYDWQGGVENFLQPRNSELNLYSDATLQVLTSKENPNFKIIFQDMFPTELSTLNFDATKEDIQYFTADVTFKYTIYNITDMSGNKL
jgi:hypothetical protein